MAGPREANSRPHGNHTEAVAAARRGRPASLAMTHLLRRTPHGVSFADPGALTVACLVTAGASLVAVYLPARKATKVDPMAALRVE